MFRHVGRGGRSAKAGRVEALPAVHLTQARQCRAFSLERSMKVTNNHKSKLALPDGTVLVPGVPTPVKDGDLVKKNVVVQGWVKAKVLTIEGAAAGGADDAGAGNPGGEGEADKVALLARAKELGIDAKGTWGIPKLQEAIAAVEQAGNPGGEG